MTKKIWPLLSVICFLALCATACAPQQQAYPPPRAENSASLPLQSWLPKNKPKAVIIALHGFNDYNHAFQGTGEFFRSHGIAVIAYDQRGFGKSPHTGL